jgi:hypothetical protein
MHPRAGRPTAEKSGGIHAAVGSADRMIVCASGKLDGMLRPAVAALAATFLVAGCATSGTQTDCGLDGCTVTFPRSGDTSVSVLGVEARLVGVQNGTAQVVVAGQQVTVPVGGQADAGGFTVGVERVTDKEVVVRVRA